MEVMFLAADGGLFGVAVLSGRTWILAGVGRRRHRRRARPAVAGEKSRLLRDALARRIRDLAVPVPA